MAETRKNKGMAHAAVARFLVIQAVQASKYPKIQQNPWVPTLNPETRRNAGQSHSPTPFPPQAPSSLPLGYHQLTRPSDLAQERVRFQSISGRVLQRRISNNGRSLTRVARAPRLLAPENSLIRRDFVPLGFSPTDKRCHLLLKGLRLPQLFGR